MQTFITIAPPALLATAILLGFWAADNFIYLVQHRERIKALAEEDEEHGQ